MTTGHTILLASTSPRRSSLLQEAGIPFVVRSPEVEELPAGALPPRALVQANADRKAFSVSEVEESQVILAADTVVVLGDTVLGKPAHLEEARSMLEALSGKTHEVLTGVCLLQPASRRMCQFVEATRVKFRPVSAPEIEAYLQEINPLDKAGAYAAQEDAGRLIECVEGSFSNVVGLPVERLQTALEKHFPQE